MARRLLAPSLREGGGGALLISHNHGMRIQATWYFIPREIAVILHPE